MRHDLLSPRPSVSLAPPLPRTGHENTATVIRLLLRPIGQLPPAEHLAAARVGAGRYRLRECSMAAPLAAGDEVCASADRAGRLQILDVGAPSPVTLSVIAAYGMPGAFVEDLTRGWRTSGAQRSRVYEGRICTTWSPSVDPDIVFALLIERLDRLPEAHLLGVYAPADRNRRLIGSIAHLPSAR